MLDVCVPPSQAADNIRRQLKDEDYTELSSSIEQQRRSLLAVMFVYAYAVLLKVEAINEGISILIKLVALSSGTTVEGYLRNKLHKLLHEYVGLQTGEIACLVKNEEENLSTKVKMFAMGGNLDFMSGKLYEIQKYLTKETTEKRNSKYYLDFIENTSLLSEVPGAFGAKVPENASMLIKDDIISKHKIEIVKESEYVSKLTLISKYRKDKETILALIEKAGDVDKKAILSKIKTAHLVSITKHSGGIEERTGFLILKLIISLEDIGIGRRNGLSGNTDIFETEKLLLENDAILSFRDQGFGNSDKESIVENVFWNYYLSQSFNIIILYKRIKIKQLQFVKTMYVDFLKAALLKEELIKYDPSENLEVLGDIVEIYANDVVAAKNAQQTIDAAAIPIINKTISDGNCDRASEPTGYLEPYIYHDNIGIGLCNRLNGITRALGAELFKLLFFKGRDRDSGKSDKESADCKVAENASDFIEYEYLLHCFDSIFENQLFDEELRQFAKTVKLDFLETVLKDEDLNEYDLSDIPEVIKYANDVVTGTYTQQTRDAEATPSTKTTISDRNSEARSEDTTSYPTKAAHTGICPVHEADIGEESNVDQDSAPEEETDSISSLPSTEEPSPDWPTRDQEKVLPTDLPTSLAPIDPEPRSNAPSEIIEMILMRSSMTMAAHLWKLKNEDAVGNTYRLLATVCHEWWSLLRQTSFQRSVRSALRSKDSFVFYQPKASFRQRLNSNLDVNGLAVCDSRIFVTGISSSVMEVYDATSCKQLQMLTVSDMTDPWDIAASPSSRCLFVLEGLYHVLRLGLDGHKDISWTLNGDQRGLSVSRRNLVIITYRDRLEEFDNAGTILNSVKLDNTIYHTSHSVSINSENFVLCHGSGRVLTQHAVCLVDQQGQIRDRFQDSSAAIYQPLHLAVADHGCIFVADIHNQRVQILSEDLRRCFELISTRIQRGWPVRVCYDSPRGNVYVCTLNGQVLVYRVRTRGSPQTECLDVHSCLVPSHLTDVECEQKEE